MKEINLHLDKSINYPVSKYIQDNISIIQAIIKEINKLNIIHRIVFCCRGSSGAIMAGIASYNIPNSTIFHIKKAGENSHDDSNYFCFHEKDYIIIIDDFISSGKTMLKIYEAIKKNTIIPIRVIALGGICGNEDVIETIHPEILIHNKH
jgi:orotate phosphoribosyltransferase-like protein